MSHWVSQGSPCVPRNASAASPTATAAAHSVSSYAALIASETESTRKKSHPPGRSGEVRSRISRARIAGTKPCTKWANRS